MRWVSLKPLRKNYNLTLTNPDLSPHSLSTESSQRDLKFPVGKFLVVTRRFVPSPDDGREIEGLKWAQHILCIFQFEVDWAAILQWYCFHEGGTWFHHGPFSTARSKVTKCALGGEQFFLISISRWKSRSATKHAARRLPGVTDHVCGELCTAPPKHTQTTWLLG